MDNNISNDDFIAEFHVMDLNELRDKNFIVAVNTGDRDGCKHLASTIHGPYDFYEMCEEVGTMWATEQHHAKVTILSKEKKRIVPVKLRKKDGSLIDVKDKKGNPVTREVTCAAEFLDYKTTDYIEAHYLDIIADMLVDGATEKPYTCKAGTVTEGDIKELIEEEKEDL